RSGSRRPLGRTLQDPRPAGVAPSSVRDLPLGGPDLAALLNGFDEQFAAARAIDRAALFDAATRALQLPAPGSRLSPPGSQLPAHGFLVPALLLLDVAIDSDVELSFVGALLARLGCTLITLPFGDLATVERLETLGLREEVLEQKDGSDLAALRGSLFADRQPPERDPAGDVVFYSAPGEGRECVEIARRVLREAARGVPFDEMAVFLRAPDRYAGLLEHAFRRAGIPGWFDRGTPRPHPAARP